MEENRYIHCKEWLARTVEPMVVKVGDIIRVDLKAQRLFYKLNKDTKVKVRTGCGDSEWGKVGDIIGQGSGRAA